jgi:hypothetical protein
VSALPSRAMIRHRCQNIARLARAEGFHVAMIGGAPWMMGTLEHCLLDVGIAPIYAFSKRNVVEGDDGTKVVKFVHEGFIPACGVELHEGSYVVSVDLCEA